MIRKSGLLFLGIALVSIVSMDSQAQYTSTLHVRETIRNGGAQTVGRLPANQVMQLDICCNCAIQRD
jgi:hypothetical protein